ncbi:hypothetical protein [Xanthomonas campestris]|uniref:hypothetical protein n=1 Tax=Xanthomonas campestris TaxID=339 RepID=UPI00128FDE4C|nr:hypothetical protein [Xanthomonas campestris]MCW1977223.1 hypothetical protein [Xanthomonas campestris]MEA9739531.1 hypothetical protein [Xanthomonas campestris pv. raphani]
MQLQLGAMEGAGAKGSVELARDGNASVGINAGIGGAGFGWIPAMSNEDVVVHKMNWKKLRSDKTVIVGFCGLDSHLRLASALLGN